jgi:hypothetical protein
MSYNTKMFISVVGMLLIVGYVIFASGLFFDSSRLDSTGSGGAAVKTAEAFSGGTFEASGVAHVSGADAILFVDDGKPGEVQWMQLTKEGKQSGSVKSLKLGVDIEDLEGITTDGTYFYVVSSQSRPKAIEKAGLVRFKLDAGTQTVSDVQAVSELKRFLVENVAELRGFASTKAKDDGINIEGLSWDPAQGRLLLGLRSPTIDGNALLVPLKLRDPRGQFSYENMETERIETVKLPVGGMGIRSIEYDGGQRLFHIIAGATESQDKTDFKLWQWEGKPDKASLREVTTFDRKLKPEGVTSVAMGDGSHKFIVFDSSHYLMMQ